MTALSAIKHTFFFQLAESRHGKHRLTTSSDSDRNDGEGRREEGEETDSHIFWI